MKHINKNPEALIINVEFPSSGSPTGLPLVATVYSIHTGLWMCHLDPNTGTPLFTYPTTPPPGYMPIYAWSSLAPGTGSYAAATGAPYEAYEVPLMEMSYRLGIFGDGKYWINLTAAHNALDKNDGSVIYAPDCASLPNWDASVSPSGALAPPGPGFAGSIGYLIRISDATGASGLVMPTPPIYIHLTVDEATRDVNVVEWLGNPVSASVGGFPDVNVHEYNAAAVNPTTAGVPDVNVIEVMGNANAANGLEDFGANGYDTASSAVNIVHSVNNLAAGSISTASFDDDAITAAKIADNAIHAAAIANDAIHANTIAGGAIHSGNSTGDTPAIAEGAIHADNNNQGTSLPAIEAAAIHATAIADDAIHDAAIADDAIHADTIAEKAIHDKALDAGAIHDGFTDSSLSAVGSAIEDGAIHDAALAENAINEEAIKIDSVTYEEISNSAISEIVSGIWNADVFKPIDVSVDGGGSRDYSGTNYASASKGSVGHAMLLQYISQNILHWDAADGALTSLHQCSHDDPTGTRFYSASLPALSADVAKGYIDKAAVVVKNWTIDSDANGDEEFYLVRITGVGADAHGNFIEIHMVDEDESPIPSGGLLSGSDALLIKEETDSTMHEVAHEVWEESVFDHETPDTFGMLNRIMAGLSQFNHQITDSMYDESGRLLSCRLVVYASSDDARDGVNPLTTIEVNSSYDEKQNMKTFVSAEEKKVT